jgi:hypothetical protein
MKENPKNLIKSVIAGAVAFTAVENSEAQTKSSENNKIVQTYNHQFIDNSNPPKDTKDNTFYLNKDTLPKFDFKAIYNQDKESDDESFNQSLLIEKGLPENVTLYVNYKFDAISVRVTTKNSDPNGMTIKETFTSLADLNNKYPKYSSNIPSLDSIYNEYVMEMAWQKILLEKQKTLSNNFENYVPTQEEINILKNDAEKKNSGSSTNDGYDAIHSYYMNESKTPEALYNFYLKYDGTPETLTSFMMKKYYVPLLKNK